MTHVQTSIIYLRNNKIIEIDIAICWHVSKMKGFFFVFLMLLCFGSWMVIKFWMILHLMAP